MHNLLTSFACIVYEEHFACVIYERYIALVKCMRNVMDYNWRISFYCFVISKSLMPVAEWFGFKMRCLMKAVVIRGWLILCFKLRQIRADDDEVIR